MSSLRNELKTSRRSAFAEGSVKIQWESYLMFCLYFGLSYLPSTTENLCLYAQFLSRTFKSTQSIKNYISGIKTMHYLLGYTTDAINDFLINLSVRGISRLNPDCVKQAQAITPDMLLQIVSVLDFSNAYDNVYWCLFLFAFFLFARKSVPSSKKDLKDKKFMLRKDIQIGEDVLIVSMRWSKTIQFGERVLKTPLVTIPDSVLCPVKAFKIMCSKVKAKPEDPLFTLPEKKCITYQSFQKKLRELVQKIGLEPESFSSHSCRRGGLPLHLDVEFLLN